MKSSLIPLTFLPILTTNAAVLDILLKRGSAWAQAGGAGDSHPGAAPAAPAAGGGGSGAPNNAGAAAWASFSHAGGAPPAQSQWHSVSWGGAGTGGGNQPASAAPNTSPAAAPAASPAAPAAPAASPADSSAQAATPAPAAAPAASPAAGSGIIPTSYPGAAPAAVSSIMSSLADGSGGAIPSGIGINPAGASSIISAAMASNNPIASGGAIAGAGAGIVTGLAITTAHPPSAGDSIPAAQCSGGSTLGGQWAPFLIAHQNPNPALMCPTDDSAGIHWFLDNEQVGCCPQSAYLTTAVAGQWACCPCGSTCAGLPPAMWNDWGISSGQLFLGHSTTPYIGLGAGTIVVATPTPVPGVGTAISVAGGGLVTNIAGQPYTVPFAPSGGSSGKYSSAVYCMAEGCETILFGGTSNSQQFTIIDPNGRGAFVTTTATRVLMGTVGGKVLPTSTAYAVVEAGAGAGPRPWSFGVMSGGIIGNWIGMGIMGFGVLVGWGAVML